MRMHVLGQSTPGCARRGAALALLLMASGSAWADDAALLRCRELAAPDERFACYEAIVVKGPALTPVRPAPAAPRPDVQFGLENKVPPPALQAIESNIRGRFEGWGPGDIIVLANGQRWQVSDDSRGAMAMTDPKVKVRRGALGSFYLEIDGTNRSPKVRRLP